MAESGANENTPDDLDAFFTAAGSGEPADIARAAERLEAPPPNAAYPPPASPAAPGADADAKSAVPPPGGMPPELEGKFLVFDNEGGKEDEPFVLVPAHIYSYVPWWGWTAIGIGLVMLAAGVIFMPVWSLDRLASRLGDSNEAEAQFAMRTLVMNGDERTVKKLFSMAASDREGLTARLRAVDAMSLIGGVPEVDRALLRLELSGGTNDQVREAAIAARKQREAARTRGLR